MKRWILIGIFLIMLTPIVYSEPNVAQNNDIVLKKVDTESEEIKLYIDKQFKADRKIFFDEFEARANYYEDEYKKQTNKMFLKFALFYLAVVMISHSLSNLLRIRMKKKEYAIMRQSIEKDLVEAINKNYVVVPKESMGKIVDFNLKKVPTKPMTEPPKPSEGVQ